MEYKDEESLKFERTASGKYVYSFKLIGKPEDNMERLKNLQVALDKQIEDLMKK